MTSLHGPVFTDFGKNEPSSASFGSILILSSRPCGDCMSRNPRMRARHFVDVGNFQRQIHAALAAQHVDEQRNARALWLLEQQRRAAGTRHAIGNLRDFEDRIDFRGDAAQLAFFFQFRNEFTQISVRQTILRSGTAHERDTSKHESSMKRSH